MPADTRHVSLATLVAASPLLGHELEDRQSIQDGQDPDLVAHFTSVASRPLSSPLQRQDFVVAPLDLLVSCGDAAEGRCSGPAVGVHLLELNGTGIGGVTNLPPDCVDAILTGLEEIAGRLDDPAGVVAVAVSGRESRTSPRANRLLHEKLLFVDALRAGLEKRFGNTDVSNIHQLAAASRGPRAARPTVVLGYIKDLLDAATVDADGGVRLHGRRLMAAVNDRFCGNLVQRLAGDGVDPESFLPVNRCYTAGSDKGIAYRMVNSFLERHPQRLATGGMLHAHAHTREELIEAVAAWLAVGRQTVIKPHGTGLGHGIEFFLDPATPRAEIAARVDASLRQTAEYYGTPHGSLPYTLCEYVDACRVADPAHPLAGHRYELRVVVYRDGGQLRAVPSVAKVARERADRGPAERRSLINNVTASGDTAKVRGTDFVLPLCNAATLATLGLSMADLEAVAEYAVGLVGHTLDRRLEDPAAFELVPSTTPAVPAPLRASA
jgi:hypothetical protein